MCEKSEVAPAYNNGFERKKGTAVKIFCLMTLVFLIALVPGSYMTPSPKFCPTEGDCKRPEIFAFEFVNACTFLWQSIIAIRSYHFRKTPMKTFAQTPEGRVFGFSKESEMIACVSMTIQFWGLIFTNLIAEFSSAIMLGHHFIAALVSYIALRYQYYYYYSVFYLALSEVSSLPLLVMSISKYFPPAQGSLFAIAQDLSGPTFAVTFTYYRVYLWLKTTKQLWKDVYYCLSTGVSNKFRPGLDFCLYLILICCALLSFLQLYWFKLIVMEVLRAIGFELPETNPGFE